MKYLCGTVTTEWFGYCVSVNHLQYICVVAMVIVPLKTNYNSSVSTQDDSHLNE